MDKLICPTGLVLITPEYNKIHLVVLFTTVYHAGRETLKLLERGTAC